LTGWDDWHVDDFVVAWLLGGDVAVQYQTWRDLLGRDDPALQCRIAAEGLGAAILKACGGEGHWGRGFYQPKWTSSHYTLLELKNLGVSNLAPRARDVVRLILDREKGPDGGLNATKTVRPSDACVNAMALNYASYFGADEDHLASIVDFLLRQRLGDGGLNCRLNQGGARHSSVHTTVCAIEAITQYQRSGYGYRLDELRFARAEATDFLLRHHLYRSERTGETMSPEFTRLHHPARWHFDILRGLESLADAGTAYDPRMADALRTLESRRHPDGRWAANRPYPGVTHLPPPRAGEPNRWISLMALRVLNTYAVPE
jgi:hypothetical protein